MIEKIIGSRCSGKTTRLVSYAVERNIPILCKDKVTGTQIVEIAKRVIEKTPDIKEKFDRQRIVLTMTGVEIFLIKNSKGNFSIFSDTYEPRGHGQDYVIRDIYVDDAEYVLQNLLSGGTFLNWLAKTGDRFNIKGLTMTTIDEPNHTYTMIDTMQSTYRIFK